MFKKRESDEDIEHKKRCQIDVDIVKLSTTDTLYIIEKRQKKYEFTRCKIYVEEEYQI